MPNNISLHNRYYMKYHPYVASRRAHVAQDGFGSKTIYKGEP
jgi:hypothetical protein